MTATQKQDGPLPAAIPGGFARSPASSRVATVRFAHPFAVVAAAFKTPGTMTQPSPSGWPRLSAFSAWVSDPDDAEPPPAANHGQPATSLQHARPPVPRTSQLPNWPICSNQTAATPAIKEAPGRQVAHALGQG